MPAVELPEQYSRHGAAEWRVWLADLGRHARRRYLAGAMQGTAAAARLVGTLFVSTSRALYLYVGPLVATARHAHHAAQLILAPEGLYLEDGAGGRIRASTAVI